MTSDIAYRSATDLIRCYRNGSLSPVDVTGTLLQRAQRLQAGLNATTWIDTDGALKRADESAARYRAGTARPLEGVPVAIKEETAVAGWPRTIGSYLHDELPTQHHPIVDRLIEAGAVPHLQTTVPEFCVIGQTFSARYGVSRNPWNRAVTPGGSSGGSGAALAAGLAPLATGSDMAGSTRIPAALNGVYGYKPPFGRLAATPREELFAFAVEGPLARSLDDLRLLQNVIQGPHPASYSGMPATPLTENPPDLAGVRLALALPKDGIICADTARNLVSAAAALREAGAIIDEVTLDWDVSRVGEVLIEAIFGLYFAEYLEGFSEADKARATPYLRYLMKRYCGRRNSIMASAVLASEMHHEMVDKLWSRGATALLCPTLLCADMPADLELSEIRQWPVAGGFVDSYLGWVWTAPFNLLSRTPAMAAPTGLASNGVPTSLQIVGAPYADADVFRVAHHYARHHPVNLYRTVFPSLPEVE
jgi:Asp-tRNA(Asn)/Glu-tRNA(Gln) amidotransferase A subunit family amidase